MGTTRFERDAVGGIRLHVLSTDRFKTTAVSVFVGTLLQESTVTSVALAPFVLRRGNASYPETKAFREALDDLYGAGFGFDIYKRGDYQIVNFRMDVIRNEFAAGGAPLLQQAIGFLGETLTQPALEDGRFLASYVEAEKHTVQKKLEAIVNDKGRYAAERCIEEMCKDEPYRLHPLGQKEDLAGITPESLYDSYQSWLAGAPIDVYVVGNTTIDEVKRLVQDAFAVRGNDAPTSYTSSRRTKRVTDVNTVIERMEVGQGKLNMGIRTPAAYAEPSYATALLYNGILGSFPHSKLFLNVREKESLAYYASSRLDGHKGIITISSGIEIDKYERAVEIIKKQLEAMRAGDISELEMNQTKAMISNHLREMNDSAYEMIGFDFNTVLSGKERTAESLLGEIERVSVPDIAAFAQDVQLDTVYFLRDRKED
ncbi:insulinase family protein [Paenibacillus antri]|uniref:Insulinase family protein n=1 Tax=Paenibacillus antri TaxID=2582848 RepID=A0A5R9G938_9BACL|nr:pitrilysin family protein [Paenibacillus antri]TLS52261.1 insulinase family protein [Paenibacillus antri]